MPPANATQWHQVKLPYRVTSAASTCVTFLLLTISLLSPSWLDVIVPETSEAPNSATGGTHCNQLFCGRLQGSSDFMKAVRILLTLATIAGFIAAITLFVSCPCGGHSRGLPNMLVSSASSFTAGGFGFATMALYTVDITQNERSSAGHIRFTWSFCLTWLVFSLYVMNGVFSLLTYFLQQETVFECHSNDIFQLGRLQQTAAGDSLAVGPSVLPFQATPTTPVRNPFPVPSICLNSTII